MAYYYTDFGSYTTGNSTSLPNWTERWSTTGNTYSIIVDANAIGGKYLRITNSSANRKAIYFNAPGTSVADADVLVRIRMGQVSASHSRIIVRGSGSTGSESAYFANITNITATGAATMGLAEYNNGAASTLDDTPEMPYVPGVWYWLRLQAHGTTIRQRLWTGSVDDEPSTWTQTATDSSLTSGWVGLASYETGLQFDCDWFSVGTDGDIAVPPVVASGPRYPSSAIQTGSGTAWSNITRIYTSNNSDATVVITNDGISYRLWGYNLGFNIPTGSKIRGFLVEPELAATTGGYSTRLYSVLVGMRNGSDVTLSGSFFDGTTQLTTTDAFYPKGGAGSGNFGLTASDVNSSNFAIGVIVRSMAHTSGFTFYCDSIRVTVYYSESTNSPPVMTVPPTISYGAGTRAGPNNTPSTITFTAEDQETTEANGLTWYLWATIPDALISSGTLTSGVSKTINVPYDTVYTTEGQNTLRVLVSDSEESTGYYTVSLLSDWSAPLEFEATPSATMLGGNTEYSVSLVAQDTYSTGTNELRWEIRTGSNGTGVLLASGNRTSSSSSFSSGTFTDTELENGDNIRYVRVIDGAFNVRETSYTVTSNTPPVVTVAPDVDYGIRSVLGPNNTPVQITFTVIDQEQTAMNDLSYQIRTESGIVVHSGTVTSGIEKEILLSYSASGLVGAGNQTLLLRVYDGSNWSEEIAFILKQDNNDPVIGTIIVDPEII